MIAPMKHLNGTPGPQLDKAFQEAYEALNAFSDALDKMAPNGRDYYPISDSAFGQAVEEHEERRLAFDQVGEVEVSTVFLGIDHNFAGGEPILWETMVFGGKHNDFQQRYSTKEMAIAGHRAAVGMVEHSAPNSLS